MKAVVVCALLCIVAAVALETLPKKDEPKIRGVNNKGPNAVVQQLEKRLNKDKLSKKSTSSGAGSSSHKHADPKILAEKAVHIFGDADGSAGFNGLRVLENTVAEVPNKKHHKHHKHSSGHGSGSGTGGGSGSSRKEKSLLKDKVLGKLGQKLGSKTKHHKKEDVAPQSPRQKRPLFNFKHAPHGADSVVIRKHHFGHKHHKLVTSFANKHEKVQLVLVVDAYVSPRGRPSKKLNDKKKRGHRKSDVNLTGVRHSNLFVFDDKGTQLFPKGHGSSHSSHSKSSSSQKKTSLNDKPKLSPLAGLKPPPPIGQKTPQLGGIKH